MNSQIFFLKTWVFSFFLILSFDSYACYLSARYKYVSLSGPVTFLLEELNLLNDSALTAISKFHEVKDFKKDKVGGGIFLSESKLNEWKNHVVFYDESRDLEKTLMMGNQMILVKMKSRGLDPFQATMSSMNLLRPYLMNCANKLVDIEKKLNEIEQKLISSSKRNENHYFFLGELTKEKLPSLLILDGPVMSLKKHQMIKTYESTLYYIYWSEKELEKVFDQEGFYWGLNESKIPQLKSKNISKNKSNLYYRGVLIPGITQVKFLDEFFKTFLNKI